MNGTNYLLVMLMCAPALCFAAHLAPDFISPGSDEGSQSHRFDDVMKGMGLPTDRTRRTVRTVEQLRTALRAAGGHHGAEDGTSVKRELFPLIEREDLAKYCTLADTFYYQAIVVIFADLNDRIEANGEDYDGLAILLVDVICELRDHAGKLFGQIKRNEAIADSAARAKIYQELINNTRTSSETGLERENIAKGFIGAVKSLFVVAQENERHTVSDINLTVLPHTEIGDDQRKSYCVHLVKLSRMIVELTYDRV